MSNYRSVNYLRVETVRCLVRSAPSLPVAVVYTHTKQVFQTTVETNRSLFVVKSYFFFVLLYQCVLRCNRFHAITPVYNAPIRLPASCFRYYPASSRYFVFRVQTTLFLFCIFRFTFDVRNATTAQNTLRKTNRKITNHHEKMSRKTT